MTTIRDTDARPLFCVNASEREALRGLRWIAHEVYLFGLRPFMDYSSGIVGGPARRVSYQSIAEELYVEPGPGIRDSGKPSERQIRRAIESLQRAGLLSVNRCQKIRKTGKTDYQPYLVFECLLAKRDRSVKKKADSLNTVQTGVSVLFITRITL